MRTAGHSSREELEPIVSCPVCHACEADELLAPRPDRAGLLRCRSCRLVRATGQRAAVPHARVIEGVGRRERRCVGLYDRLSGGLVLSPSPRARALDLGCGQGALLDELAAAGYDTVGLGTAGPDLERAAQRHDVHDLSLQDAAAEIGADFELVTVRRELAMVRDPVHVLRWIRERLTAAGIVVIEVPNWADAARRAWGTRYRGSGLGDQVSFFERRTLAAAIEGAELSLRALWAKPQGATLIVPSVLSAVDLASGWISRVAGSSLGPVSVSEGLVGALDRLDPMLDRIVPARAGWGATIVAIASRPPA